MNVAKEASSLAFASLIQQCYWEKSILLDRRKVNRNRKIFMVAGRQQTYGFMAKN